MVAMGPWSHGCMSEECGRDPMRCTCVRKESFDDDENKPKYNLHAIVNFHSKNK